MSTEFRVEQDDRDDRPPASLRGLGITLLSASLLHVFLMLTNVAYYLPLALGNGDNRAFAAQILLLSVVVAAYNVVLIYGALAILQRKGFTLAFLSCCLAIVPCFGPVWVLGIPIGIWGIIVLRRPGVRESFE